MTYSIYFKKNGNSDLIASDNIMKLHQSANMFSSTFRLGATVCRQFDLDIDKAAFLAINPSPDEVLIYDDTNTLYATLVVDELDASNDVYYSYSLTDRMVRLGNVTAQPWRIADATLQDYVNAICSAYGLSTPPTLAVWGSVHINWADTLTAREFIGYLAEILGGYAYITADNKLAFQAFSNTPTDTIAVEDCSSFKVNETMVFDRVVYDAPNRVVKFPDDSSYTGTGLTYYIDIDNQLMTDDTTNTPPTITIEDEVQYIYSKVNGLSFSNITVEKCPVDEYVKCGDCVAFTLDGNIYYTIAEVDWDYNSMWLGGYALAVENGLQEETAVTPIQSASRRITQYIDREIGEVGTIITDMQNNITANSSAIQQNAQQILLQVQALAQQIPEIVEQAGFVTQTQLQLTANGINATIDSVRQTEAGHWEQIQTVFEFTSAGLIIGKSGSIIKGIFDNDSLDFVDDQGHRLAWVDANDGLGGSQLSLGDYNYPDNRWRIFVTEGGEHLRITRHNSSSDNNE